MKTEILREAGFAIIIKKNMGADHAARMRRLGGAFVFRMQHGQIVQYQYYVCTYRIQIRPTCRSIVAQYRSEHS